MLIALALAGCGSEPERPSGPDPDGTGAPVTLAFADSALQAVVEESGAGAEVVSLTAEDRGIADLGGIEQLTRLEALDLSHNEITDISPLAGLHRLRFLDLESNLIEDVSALASLKRLQVLLLADNAVRDLSALAGLDSLQSLGLTGNPLSGTETTAFLDGLRERGVTVDFEAPGEAGVNDDDSVPPLKETQLLFSTSRGTGFAGHRELYSLDLESGEVVDLSVTLALAPLGDGSAPEASEHGPPSVGRSPARSPDGSKVAFSSTRDGNGEIYVMRADGSRPANLTLHEAWDGDPCWSPDGRRIAFTSDRHGERELMPGSGYYNRDIFIMNADGTGVRQLTFDPVNAYDPAWSPDGLSIAFVSDRDVPNGPAAIHVVDLASGVDRRLYGSDDFAWDPSWSPDAAWIAFGQQSDRTSHVWVMAADGSGARQLTFAEAWVNSPTWSPDGTRIAFERDDRDDDVGSDIYIVSLESGAEERITDHPGEDSAPNWTPF